MDLGKVVDFDGWVGLLLFLFILVVIEYCRVFIVVIELLGVNVYCDEVWMFFFFIKMDDVLFVFVVDVDCF